MSTLNMEFRITTKDRNQGNPHLKVAGLMYEVRRLCPRLVVLGIPMLNPRHPLLSDQLEVLEELSQIEDSGSPDGLGQSKRTQRAPSLRTIIAMWVRCLLFAFRDCVSLLFMKVQFHAELKRAMNDPATVILRTWCFGPASLGGSSDFYYGTLLQQLEERGIRCLLMCGDTRGKIDRKFMRAALERSEIRSFPEQLLVPSVAPLIIACKQLQAALALRRLAEHHADPRIARVCALASRGSLQTGTQRNVLHYYIARRAVTVWRAKVFVTFYEGQPWESPAWCGVRAARRDCVIAGFQHTVVMPHSTALVSPNQDARSCYPDIVLCAGEVTRRMMEAGHAPLKNQLVVFGTFRRAKGDQPTRVPQSQRRRVLVLPEGFLTEARLLFDFAMQAAALLPDHRFILRTHPVLPFDQVRPYLQNAPELLPNVLLSAGGSITAEFDQASVLFYRGSSAVLYGVLHGLKPIYLHDNYYPDVDPLSEIRGWREQICSPEELAQSLRRYAATENPDSAQEWRNAKDYADAYTIPVNQMSIERFLKAAGLSQSESDRIDEFALDVGTDGPSQAEAHSVAAGGAP